MKHLFLDSRLKFVVAHVKQHVRCGVVSFVLWSSCPTDCTALCDWDVHRSEVKR